MKVYVDASPTRLCVTCEDGQTIVRNASTPHTSNEAKYLAVLAAVKQLPSVTEVCSDSQLVVKQLNGEYKVNKPELLRLRDEILRAANGRVKFTWIPKEENPAGKVLG